MKPEVIPQAEMDARAKAAKDAARRARLRDRAVALSRVDRLPVLAGEEARAEVRSAQGREVLRRPARSSRCSRTSGCAAARCGRWVPKAFADKPVYVFETGGTTGIPKSRIVIDDFRIDYETVQRHAARQVLPQGRQLADARALRPAAAAAGGRAPGPVSRRHLLLRRPRSALGRQAHQEGLDGAPRSVQGALHRPGDDDPRRPGTTSSACSPRRSCSKRCAMALEKRGHEHCKDTGITGIFSGGTEFTPQWTRFASRSTSAARRKRAAST